MNRVIDLSDWRSRCMVCVRLMHKKNTSKDCDNRDNNNNNNNKYIFGFRSSYLSVRINGGMENTEFSQTYKRFIVLNSRILVNSYFISKGTNLVKITIYWRDCIKSTGTLRLVLLILQTTINAKRGLLTYNKGHWIVVNSYRHRTNDLLQTDSSKTNDDRMIGQPTIWITVNDCFTCDGNSWTDWNAQIDSHHSQ